MSRVFSHTQDSRYHLPTKLSKFPSIFYRLSATSAAQGGGENSEIGSASQTGDSAASYVRCQRSALKNVFTILRAGF
jgi:hypothetical protein